MHIDRSTFPLPFNAKKKNPQLSFSGTGIEQQPAQPPVPAVARVGCTYRDAVLKGRTSSSQTVKPSMLVLGSNGLTKRFEASKNVTTTKTGTPASTEAAPPQTGTSASTESAPPQTGTSASTEAATSQTGTSASTTKTANSKSITILKRPVEAGSDGSKKDAGGNQPAPPQTRTPETGTPASTESAPPQTGTPASTESAPPQTEAPANKTRDVAAQTEAPANKTRDVATQTEALVDAASTATQTEVLASTASVDPGIDPNLSKKSIAGLVDDISQYFKTPIPESSDIPEFKQKIAKHINALAEKLKTEGVQELIPRTIEKLYLIVKLVARTPNLTEESLETQEENYKKLAQAYLDACSKDTSPKDACSKKISRPRNSESDSLTNKDPVIQALSQKDLLTVYFLRPFKNDMGFPSDHEVSDVLKSRKDSSPKQLASEMKALMEMFLLLTGVRHSDPFQQDINVTDENLIRNIIENIFSEQNVMKKYTRRDFDISISMRKTFKDALKKFEKAGSIPNGTRDESKKDLYNIDRARYYVTLRIKAMRHALPMLITANEKINGPQAFEQEHREVMNQFMELLEDNDTFSAGLENQLANERLKMLLNTMPNSDRTTA
ncbi:MAG: hypothetical protein AAGI66_06780 [Cyanobacteria bacterium P01_H01_bin.74]